MKKCPRCRTTLTLINMLMTCEQCGYYRLIGKAKARNKVVNWTTWATHVLKKEKK